MRGEGDGDELSRVSEAFAHAIASWDGPVHRRLVGHTGEWKGYPVSVAYVPVWVRLLSSVIESGCYTRELPMTLDPILMREWGPTLMEQDRWRALWMLHKAHVPFKEMFTAMDELMVSLGRKGWWACLSER